MAAPESGRVVTALRALEYRTRELSLDSQMGECIGLLESPEIVVEDLIESLKQIRATDVEGENVQLLANRESPDGTFFYPSREVFVQGDRSSFTCLATAIDFLDGKRSGRIDFAAVTCEAAPRPVIGFCQGRVTESAYPILFRSPSSLIELMKPRRFDALDRDVFRGLLGPAPKFDLALVLWDEEVADPRAPLCQLTRDLAEVLKTTLQSETRFPEVLGDLVCLRMNPQRFDGRLRFVWRV